MATSYDGTQHDRQVNRTFRRAISPVRLHSRLRYAARLKEVDQFAGLMDRQIFRLFDVVLLPQPGTDIGVSLSGDRQDRLDLIRRGGLAAPGWHLLEATGMAIAVLPPDDLPYPGRGMSGLNSVRRRRGGQGHSLRHKAHVNCELVTTVSTCRETQALSVGLRVHGRNIRTTG